MPRKAGAGDAVGKGRLIGVHENGASVLDAGIIIEKKGL